MIKNLFAKRNEKAEEVFVIWNESIFAGKKRSEILEFKEKYRKIALQRYNAMKRIEKLDDKALKAMNKIANGKDSTNLSNALPIVIGGALIATVVATNNLAVAETATNSKLDTKTVHRKTIAVIAENKDNTAKSNGKEIVAYDEKYIIENSSTEVDEFSKTPLSTETKKESSVDEVEMNFIDSVEAPKATISQNTVSIENIETEEVVMDYIENDFIIFDQALELGIERCESSFDGLGAVKEISVLDIIEKSGNNPIVEAFFQMLLDTNVNNEVVKYGISYAIPKGAVSFNSRDGKFFADIDTSMVEARIDLNLQHLIDASIKSGVDEKTRDLLLGSLNDQTQVISILHDIQFEFENEEINSGIFLNDVKNTVEKELTEYTTWDVIATFK